MRGLSRRLAGLRQATRRKSCLSNSQVRILIVGFFFNNSKHIAVISETTDYVLGGLLGGLTGEEKVIRKRIIFLILLGVLEQLHK